MPWKSDTPTRDKEKTQSMARARPGNPTLRDSPGSADRREVSPAVLLQSLTPRRAGRTAHPGLPNCLLALTQPFRFPLPANICCDNSRLWGKGTVLPLGVR